jgi:hypothetical protein
MSSEATKRWVEAGKLLSADPTAAVRCPERDDGVLVVRDELAASDSGKIERALTCPVCGAKNLVLVRRARVHAWVLGVAAGEPPARVAERLGPALGVTFAERTSVFHGGICWQAGASLAAERILVHANRDWTEEPSERLLTIAPDCTTIVRFRNSRRELAHVLPAVERALGTRPRVLRESAGLAPLARPARPGARSAVLGYPGTAPLDAVAAVVGEVLGLTLERRESDMFGGTYRLARGPDNEQIYVHPNRDMPSGPAYAAAPECPIIIRFDGTERDLAATVAALEERLGVKLQRVTP